jgi:hypothetical protein
MIINKNHHWIKFKLNNKWKIIFNSWRISMKVKEFNLKKELILKDNNLKKDIIKWLKIMKID